MYRIYSLAVVLFLGLGAAIFFPACKGDQGATGLTGPSGISAVPTPYCGSPTSNGDTVVEPLNSGTNAGYIVADPVNLSSATVGISLSVHVASGPVSGQVMMGIYADASGKPGILVANSSPQNVTAGWNICSIPNVYLPAGTYWMAFVFSNTTASSYNTGAGTQYYYSYGWTDDLPNPAPTGTITAHQDSLYLSTCP